MHPLIRPTLDALSSIVLGKDLSLRLALTCLLARGHLLVEDIPGVGKTTLALALARVLGLHFQRLQFTSDLMPADIIGVAIFDAASSSFRFHEGPLFTQLLLADEINRASPKTQSALLEAMEERQVSAEGSTRCLPQPFFVVATQNPHSQIGVFPLPESQLDRFLMRISMGYPSPQAERALLIEPERRDLLQDLPATLDPQTLIDLQAQVRKVHTAPALIDYLIALLQYTREHRGLRHGLSPRAGLALAHAAQAWALIDGRRSALPEDVQAVFSAVAGHRLVGSGDRGDSAPTAADILHAVAIP